MKLVVGCVVAALLMAYGCWVAPLAFDHDAVQYLSLAEHLARGDGYVSSLHSFHDLMQPPLYPLAVALFIKLGFPSLAAGAIVCMLAALATLVALARIHLLVWGPPGQLATIAIAATYPVLDHALNLTLEGLFVCLLAWGVERVFHGLLRDRPRAIAAGGLILGLAMLVRSEAIMSLAILSLLILVWRAPRFTRVGIFLVAAALAIVPYGLFQRAHLGRFEVLPKIRYNLPLPAITDGMAWEPDEDETVDRDLRVMHSLMPDQKTFILNYAFTHPEFDAVAAYPRRAGARGMDVRRLAHTAVLVMWECGYQMGFLHPFSLLFLLAAALSLLREREENRLLLAGALAAQVAAHLLPSIASGEDFMTRYLCAAAVLAVVLVGGGAGAVEKWAATRWPSRAKLIALGLALALGAQNLVVTLRTAPLHDRDSRARWAHIRAVEAAARRTLPPNARVLSNHPRPAFRVGALAFEMPYVRSLDELQGYIRNHQIDHAVLDLRTMRRHTSRVVRSLGDPASWPAGWTLIERVDGTAPVYFVRIR